MQLYYSYTRFRFIKDILILKLKIDKRTATFLCPNEQQ